MPRIHRCLGAANVAPGDHAWERFGRKPASAVLKLDERLDAFRLHRKRHVDDMARMLDAQNLSLKIAILHTGSYTLNGPIAP